MISVWWTVVFIILTIFGMGLAAMFTWNVMIWHNARIDRLRRELTDEWSPPRLTTITDRP